MGGGGPGGLSVVNGQHPSRGYVCGGGVWGWGEQSAQREKLSDFLWFCNVTLISKSGTLPGTSQRNNVTLAQQHTGYSGQYIYKVGWTVKGLAKGFTVNNFQPLNFFFNL